MTITDMLNEKTPILVIGSESVYRMIGKAIMSFRGKLNCTRFGISNKEDMKDALEMIRNGKHIIAFIETSVFEMVGIVDARFCYLGIWKDEWIS